MSQQCPSRSPDEIRTALRAFASDIRSIPLDSDPNPPPSTPELLDIDRKEGVWQRYLAYLIDPNARHGFGHRFLDAFLEVCESAGAFDSEHLHQNRSRVEVEVEVSTESGRRPDVLLYDRDCWFLLLELKVDADEGVTQTTDYASADQIGPLHVDEFSEEASHYGFVAPAIPNDIDERFVGVPWRAIGDAFAKARSELTFSEHPLRSIVHLDDFINTVHTTMTEVDEDTRELARLYFEYQDAIEMAEAAVPALVESELQHEWVHVLTDPETQPSYWDDSWQVPTKGITYGSFRRRNWSSSEDVSVHFEHRPTEENFRAGDLEFGLEIRSPPETRADSDPRESYCEAFVRTIRRRDIDLPDETSVSSRTTDLDPAHSLVKTYYSYEPGSLDGYYGALRRAAVDHGDLVPVVDELF